MVKAKLLKPLDGHPEGAEREFSQGDFDRLERRKAVVAVGIADAKAAPPVINKKAPAAANKAAVKKAD